MVRSSAVCRADNLRVVRSSWSSNNLFLKLFQSHPGFPKNSFVTELPNGTGSDA